MARSGAAVSGRPRIADDGQDVLGLSIQCFEGAPSCSGDRLREGEAYEFARSDHGWVTKPLAPPVPETGATTLWAADANAHATLFSQASPPEGQDDFYTTQADGSITHIGPLGQGEEA